MTNFFKPLFQSPLLPKTVAATDIASKLVAPISIIFLI